MIDRHTALELLHRHVASDRMIKHCLASEAVLRALAARTGNDPERWGLAGLLHDIDVEVTGADPKRHGLEAEALLRSGGVDDGEIIDAIARHNEQACDRPRETAFHFLLAAGETITGLIMATALVYPDKKLASVKVKSITKRMKEKAFAASVNRETILECERAGLPLEQLAQIALTAMQEIAGELGL
ncbi:MAG: HDIG domain-containing protein [Deltaproteobacteria bacterium]|nr:HDIG domain-containing protein [Deltaproteobacteria bacterium]